MPHEQARFAAVGDRHVSRMSFSSAFRPGWLLFAGNLAGTEGVVVSGEAWAVDLSAEHAAWGSRIRLTAELQDAVIIQARPPRSLEQSLWDALQRWPQPGVPDGRRWPAEVEALLALARNYPEEYERLRDGEAVLRALGG